MGRWKKNPKLEVQVLKLLNEAPNGRRYEELFRELEPGSKTTYSELLNTLVAANLVEFHYLTKTFRITDRGKEVIRPLLNNLSMMEYLVESGIISDKEEAVQAAIEYCLGNYMQFRGVNVNLLLPLQVDVEGNLIGTPTDQREWEKKEQALGLMRKISHDAEEELVAELQLFCKKYPIESHVASQFTQLKERAWPREETGALILLFSSAQDIAQGSLPILKEFLSRYKTFNVSKLERMHRPRREGRK